MEDTERWKTKNSVMASLERSFSEQTHIFTLNIQHRGDI